MNAQILIFNFMWGLTIFWAFVVLCLWTRLELKDRIKYGVGKPYELIDLQEERRKREKRNEDR